MAALPPDITAFAAVSSGLSLMLSSCPSNFERLYDIETAGAGEILIYM